MIIEQQKKCDHSIFSQFDVRASLPWPALLLLPPEGFELCTDCWTPEWEAGPPFENIEPTEPLEVFMEDTWVENPSLPDPAFTSGRKSEDEDDGAKVPTADPTG